MTAPDVTVEARLEALEAMVAALAVEPLATVPPITIGELTNVPAPGSQLAAQWAQDVSSRIVQRFPTTAALKAWAAPGGAYAIALDTGVLWVRLAVGWSQVTPWATSAPGVAVNGAAAAGPYTLATINIPADPFSGRIVHVSAFVRVYKYGPAPAQYVYVTHNGTNVLEAELPATNDISPGAAGLVVSSTVCLSGVFSLPANTVVPIVLMFMKAGSAGAAYVNAGANLNRLDVLVVPRG